MRWWHLLATGAVIAACNSIAGTGKYTLCPDETCGSSGSSGGVSDGGAGDGSSSGGQDASGDGATVQCPPTGSAIPKCSLGELSQSIHTAPDDPRLIRAPSDNKEAPYVPNCMMIRAGQSVTWQGDLRDHPLTDREDSDEPNPSRPTSVDATTVTYTFPCPGDFNFSCRNHRDTMLGTIRVLP
jgi:plastocyanin